MNLTGVILEFIVTGTVSATGVALLVYGLRLDLPDINGLSNVMSVFLGTISLLVLYWFGTVAHYTTWIWWKPWFHRRWLDEWVESPRGTTLLHLAEQSFLASQTGKNTPDYRKWKRVVQAGIVLDWCRFYIFQEGHREAQNQYLRQFHLYRLAYGPLAILIIGNAVFSASLVLYYPAPSLQIFLAGAVWCLVVLSFLIGHHRVTRMWKYLAISASVAQ